MHKRILIVQGHPHAEAKHFCHALADAYAAGAIAQGHDVRRLDIATIDIRFLRDKAEFEHGTPSDAILAAQRDIAWSQHLLIIHPLWMGMMPALLKAFLEQVLRPGFAYRQDAAGKTTRLLQGRSARIVVTMGMPAFVYRWFFAAHAVKAFKRNVLQLCGIAPASTSLIGTVDASGARRQRALADLLRLGREAR